MEAKGQVTRAVDFNAEDHTGGGLLILKVAHETVNIYS